MFVRFTINKINSQSGVRQGILGAAFQLQRSGRLDAVTLAELTRVLEWLKTNLVTPEIFDKPENLKGVCWFKSSQSHIVDLVKGIIPIMESGGFVVEIESSEFPGEIVYEDVHQVVAIPRITARLDSATAL